MTRPDRHQRCRVQPAAPYRYTGLLVAVLYIAQLLMLCGGCTGDRLRRRTINQGSTLTDIQYGQVLDNLAMFACNPDSLAWHVRVNGGLVQVADQGQFLLGANLGGPKIIAPNAGIQTNLLHQWNVDPVIDADDLELLQLAYRKAVNPFDTDGSIKREAYDRICELSSGYHIALTHQVAFDMIETMKEHADEARREHLGNKISKDLQELYAEINELSSKPQKYEAESFSTAGGPPVAARVLEGRSHPARRRSGRRSRGTCRRLLSAGPQCRPDRAVAGQDQGALKAGRRRRTWRAESVLDALARHSAKEEGRATVRCLVGHYRGCGCDCYTWVMPDKMKTFRDFVLIVLSLVPAEAQEGSTTISGLGAANSPNF